MCLSLLISAKAEEELDLYLAKAEPAYSCKQSNRFETDRGTIVEFGFTSQTWRGIDWSHELRLYVPREVKYPKLVLLFITGGSSTSQVKPEDHAQAFALAEACGGRVAVLPQVPNQPLLDGKKEDDLIGQTFVNYMNTQEADWPLLLPMVKSAVKALDAVEAWAKADGTPVDGFVVTGASKRGWTTWLVGAVDSRVKGIAPMVIPTLNMKAQTQHQKASWGYYSEQIEDYTRRGLTEKFDDPVGAKLWKMVDPWSYLDRIKVPVLQINGTNDRYWTLDSLNLYWDDIKAPKYVVYLPNAGHSLNEHRDWAINGVGALFRHVASGTPMPRVDWGLAVADCEDLVRVASRSELVPVSWRSWSAVAATQDFREATWHAFGEAERSERYEATVPLPGTGYRAVFADGSFSIDGLEYHLSSQIKIVSPKPAN
jgi:PhoPQ-activated pathogenicity-related protein